MGSFDQHDGHLPSTSTPAPLEFSALPAGNSPNLTLVPATELERTQCWHINMHSWRGPLSPAQYLEREVFLEQQALVCDGKITFWILTFKDGTTNEQQQQSTTTTNPRPILAACETLLKEAYTARDGKLQSVLAHGIGSVFCRPEYRGKGYASRMVEELGRRLGEEAWQQPKSSARGHFSVLYSDIGQKFYARHGWSPMASNHVTLPPINRGIYDATRQHLALPAVQDLTKDNLDTICQTAIAQTEAELLTQSLADTSTTYVAIRPDSAHMLWHFAREEFQARTLYGTNPQIKGALDQETGCALLWSRVYDPDATKNSLNILKTVVPPAKHNNASAAASNGVDGKVNGNSDVDMDKAIERSLAALLLRAQLEAHAWDMHLGVEAWNPDRHTLGAARRVAKDETLPVTVREDEHICSLRWEGQGQVEWLANEKYAWC